DDSGFKTEDIRPVVFPNPSSDEFSIQLNEKTDLRITDVLGRTVKEIFNVNGIVAFGNEFIAGIYFVEMKVGDESFVRKIVKE
ncbi:MAG: T9SS type A sorting domain-containing protein, partial [Chitinophagales bacterium]|nr:T9SS type A sorting domain-containing protein [Chitinophagales bacterium]